MSTLDGLADIVRQEADSDVHGASSSLKRSGGGGMSSSSCSSLGVPVLMPLMTTGGLVAGL